MHYSKRMIPIAKPPLGEEESKAVTDMLKSGLLAQGEEVKKFEHAFAEFIGTKHAIAVSSGTAALHVALLAHDIGEGAEVITTTFSFVATANSMLLAGAKPVFADIEEESFNINLDNISSLITPRTKAIMPVHLYGQPCDMKPIMKTAVEHSLVIVEDACQAHGAEYEGKKAGSFGTGCFSFYPTKNMTTGEGGMITTDDNDIAEKTRMIRNHGQKQRYFHDVLGYNYRMTDISAAIGLCQLRKLEEFNRSRIENAKTLTEGLKGIKGLILPHVKPKVKHVFHQYTIRITEEFGMSRDELKSKLREKGIATEIYYPLPIHKQPIYEKLGYNDHLPSAEKAAEEVLSLPIHPSLTSEELDYIIESVISCQGLT